MRDIARAAGLSLGAAYYYFDSKEALVVAYYQRIQDAHEARASAAVESLPSAERRLEAVFSLKLDLIAPDRRFLGALFRFLGEADHRASLFGPATADVRARSIRTFAHILEPLGLDPALQPAAATLLWGLHLGLVLYALQDRSRGLQRSRELLRGLVRPVAQALELLRMPQLGALAHPVIDTLRTSGLLSPLAPRMEASS